MLGSSAKRRDHHQFLRHGVTAGISTSTTSNWTAGFVYNNTGTIRNAYAAKYSGNATIPNRYGFVFNNTGAISNAYWYATTGTGDTAPTDTSTAVSLNATQRPHIRATAALTRLSGRHPRRVTPFSETYPSTSPISTTYPPMAPPPATQPRWASPGKTSRGEAEARLPSTTLRTSGTRPLRPCPTCSA